MRTCVYPGSFDPFTIGHLDVLMRASALFDSVVVSILINTQKTPFFSLEERLSFIEQVARAQGLTNVRCESFSGLLVEHARAIGASAVIRGLRGALDFEYELQMASLNRILSQDVETVFLMTNAAYACVSSSMVKEIGRHGGDISHFVPAPIVNEIMERLRKP